MNDFDRLIEALIYHANMYVGCCNLHLVYAFINGYMMAAKERGDDYYAYMDGFQKYIEQRYNVDLTQNWCSILTDHYGTGSLSMEKFGQCWHDYQIKHNRY